MNTTVDFSSSPSPTTPAPEAQDAPEAPGKDTPALPDPASLDGISEPHASKYAGFDPDIHATNDDGTPKFRADGKTFALKRGRKKGSASDAPRPLPRPGDIDAEPAEAPTISCEEAARQSANTFINGARLLFGDEWEPENKDEAGNLKNAFKNYYDAKGVPNIPPEFGLIVALSVYSLPRLTHDNTRSKLGKVKEWCKKRIGRMMGR